MRGPLYSALVRAFLRLRGRRLHRTVWATEGLLAVALSDAPASWMDARVAGKPVTARNGLAVETKRCGSRRRVRSPRGRATTAPEALALAAQEAAAAAQRGFSTSFWCNETDYPFDCRSTERGSASSWADAGIRPNAVIALAVAPELFESWQTDAILARVKGELLTPRGIRTLATSEARSGATTRERSKNARVPCTRGPPGRS